MRRGWGHCGAGWRESWLAQSPSRRAEAQCGKRAWDPFRVAEVFLGMPRDWAQLQKCGILAVGRQGGASGGDKG